MRRSLWCLLALSSACGPDMMPPPAPDAGPLPCTLSADATELSFTVGDTRTLTLTAAAGACEIERVRLDRAVFQIDMEPQWPFTIAAGETLALTIGHQPTEMLLAGQPIRELVFTTAEDMLTVRLLGEAPEIGCLETRPASLSFGGIGVGDTQSATVAIVNGCSKQLELTKAEIVEGRAFTVASQAHPWPLAPGDSRVYTVTFTPQFARPVVGTLRFSTEDAQNPRQDLSLFGNALGGRIVAFPRVIEMGSVIYRATPGDVSTCGSPVRRVTVANAGIRPLTVERAMLETTASRFDVLEPRLPVTLAPGDSTEVQLRFFPFRATPPEHQIDMRLMNDASTATRFTLRGRAIADAMAQEVYTQPTAPKVDVLWVIDPPDRLGNMKDKLQAMASNTLDLLGAAGVDYRVGVTITDVENGSPGRLNECPGVAKHIRSDEGTLATRQEGLRCLIDLPLRAGQASAGLEAATEAISRNLSALFIRPDARLVVVVVSARDDESRTPNERLLAFFERPGRRSRPDGVTVHTVAPTADCGAASAVYSAASTRTGGVHLSACADDWSTYAPQLVAGATEPQDGWTLAAEPQPRTLAVTVAGRQVSEGRSGFTYDEATNAVRFAPLATPAPGDAIDVRFDPLCRE